MSQPSPCPTADQEAHEEAVKEIKDGEDLEIVVDEAKVSPAYETETNQILQLKTESKDIDKGQKNCDKTESQKSEESMQVDELSDTERNSESADLSLSEGPVGNTDDYNASGGSGSERELAALQVESKHTSVKSKKKRNQSQRLITDFVKHKPNDNKSKKSHSISNSGSDTDPVDSGDSEEKQTSVVAKVTKKKKMGNTVIKGFRHVINTRQNARDKSSDSDDDFLRPSMYKRWSDKDTEQYRSGYPGKKDDHEATANKDFYFNKISSCPEGDKIDNIHRKWKGDYHLLERHHGYIQWLFPIRETGMNWQAQDLQLHEAKAIKSDKKAHNRVLESYKLMLDFYGIELVDPKTGELKRADNWSSQFKHLNRSMHNYLRITRILKSLGEFEYEHLKEPFVKFMMTEALKEKTLPNVASSCMNYWVGTIRDDEQRKKLREYATELGYDERKF